MSNQKELNKVDINVQFEESPTRINITSGEGIKTLFGKIRKYFSDLHSVAFSGSYEDLENKPTIPDISTKMDKDNPVGTGSLSIDRKSGTTIGKNSVTLGKDCIAAGDYSLATGYQNTVNAHYASAEGASNTINTYGYYSHVEGWSNTVSGNSSHAEGYGNKASNLNTHAEGKEVIASGQYAHAQNYNTTASGEAAHAEGRYSKAQSISTHAEGCFTIAASPDQHAEGRYNKIDSEGIYAHIVGNGSSDSNRSNAYTLDWDGNGIYSGKVSVGTDIIPTEDNDLATKKYVDNNISAVNAQIGNPENLSTTDKSSLVNAINEVKASAGGGSASLPIGVIMPIATPVVPEKWLLCDGSEVSRETYSDLFNAIGEIYGAGDGSTTFNLPNLKGKTPVGYDESDTDFNAVGKAGGEKTHTLTVNEMPTHSHTTTYGSGSTSSAYPLSTLKPEQQRYYTQSNVSSNTTGGGQAHNIMQPYITMNYIIYAGV